MRDEVNPVMNRRLHEQAEQAALEAYHAAISAGTTEDKKIMKLMDRAAARVFRKAGTPPDAVALYSEAVTSLVLLKNANGGTPMGGS